ncbi:hypothetical protein HRbin21_01092 [bacterium HR21]|nr:hypothetical protein HRbin21_01092 [bacterium HR21]
MSSRPNLLALLMGASTLLGLGQTLWRSPQDGDTVLMGRPLLLRWDTAGEISASVWYSLDTGRTWLPLLTDERTGSFLWNVPLLDTVRLLLRLRVESGASPIPVRERRQAHQAALRSVRFSPDGHFLVTTAEEGIVKLWNVNTLEATDVLVLGTRSNVLARAAFVRDSNRVLIAFDSLLLLYERPTGQRWLFGNGVHRSFIRDLAVDPRGLYAATAADDSLVCLWDLSTLQPLRCWSEAGVSSWYSVAFSPDGTLLAYAGNDGVVYVRAWQQLAQPPQRFRQHGDSSGNRVVWSVCFGTEEALLISGGVDRTVRFWDIRAVKEHARGSHRAHVRSVRALPWGRRAVSGSLDSTVRQWTPSGTPLGAPLFHGGQVLSVDYSPDGRLIASVGRDSAIRLWESGVERSAEDTIAVVLQYPVRLRLPSLAGMPGEKALVPVLHEDYAWIPPLRSDSFACQLLLRLPTWLVEYGGTSPGSWDTLVVDTWLRAADTLVRLPVRFLHGVPTGALLELLAVRWRGTNAFRAETQAGSVLVRPHCPGTESMSPGSPLRLVLEEKSPGMLSVELLADEDGTYTLELFDSLGRLLARRSLHLRNGQHVLSFPWEAAPGLFWLVVRSPSRVVVAPVWSSR